MQENSFFFFFLQCWLCYSTFLCCPETITELLLIFKSRSCRLSFTLEKKRQELVTGPDCSKKIRTSTEIPNKRTSYQLCMLKTYTNAKRKLKSALSRRFHLDEWWKNFYMFINSITLELWRREKAILVFLTRMMQ